MLRERGEFGNERIWVKRWQHAHAIERGGKNEKGFVILLRVMLRRNCILKKNMSALGGLCSIPGEKEDGDINWVCRGGGGASEQFVICLKIHHKY